MEIEVYESKTANNDLVIIIHATNDDASMQQFWYMTEAEAFKLSADITATLHKIRI